MGRKMVKNWRPKTFSLGVKTIERLNNVFREYAKWKYTKKLESASMSEVAEICLDIGLSVMERVAETENWGSLPEIVKEKVSKAEKKPETISDLTDEDLAVLESA